MLPPASYWLIKFKVLCGVDCGPSKMWQ